jgi:hypothetical protein
MLTHPNSISVQYSPVSLGVIFFAGALMRKLPDRARQKSVTPNPHEEPCDPNGLKVRSTFGSLLGTFSSEKVRYRLVANDGSQIAENKTSERKLK